MHARKWETPVYVYSLVYGLTPYPLIQDIFSPIPCETTISTNPVFQLLETSCPDKYPFFLFNNIDEKMSYFHDVLMGHSNSSSVPVTGREAYRTKLLFFTRKFQTFQQHFRRSFF